MFEHTKELFKRNKFLIMYQQNNFKNVICMYDLKLNLVPNVFRCSFNKASYLYPERFSNTSYETKAYLWSVQICAHTEFQLGDHGFEMNS